MEGLREGYEYFVKNGGGYVGVHGATEWVDAVDSAIDKLRASLEVYVGDRRDLDSLGGYVAERWHAGTFNVDAAIKGSTDHAAVPLANDLGSVDIHLRSGADYSLKYYRTAEESLRQQATTFGEKARSSTDAAKAIESGKAAEGDLLYDGQRRLIPEDQLADARRSAFRKIAKERGNRPDQADRYERTGKQLTSKVENGEGVESKGLTKQGSRDLAADAKSGEIDLEKYGISKQQLIQLEDVMKQSLKAGITAAAIAAVLAAAPVLLDAFDHLSKTGEIDVHKLKSVGSSALGGGARGFLAGATTAAIVSSAGAGMLGNALHSLDPTVVGAIAVVAVNVIGDSVKVASGNMEPIEMADALVRDSFVASSAVLLGGVMQTLTPELPVVGYLIGSFIGSTVAGLTYAGAKKATMALCVESGFTMFGLVEQDYELPESALREIGVESLEYEALVPEFCQADAFEPELFTPDEFVPDHYEITLLRRGVIGIAKVGYVT